MNSGITETGQYGIEVAVASGPSESYTWNVEDYDLRAGSNVIISIAEDGLRMYVEE